MSEANELSEQAAEAMIDGKTESKEASEAARIRQHQVARSRTASSKEQIAYPSKMNREQNMKMSVTTHSEEASKH